ncbi:hypothetical protein BCR33DRAFT_852172 [Rhizoclosmatium globosum]|uniref:XRRM domain-containing protein n=1 Tax=Rhizoclosmatium globosum TaxID=329046 RepID=A0A1Y2C3U2_9FUNG|nr:hypothetical protein BCR33DRAFT_852172 [Rhizoclosmatium globosum]|eukprot:ORY41671.1 hypothetical protein BCR33DRAFT_852172 [Rhizoclosmatium globosum]
MSTKHEATEKLIGTLLNAFYSASNLLLDAYLLSRINEAVPISVFQSPVRLGRLAADEVVVAKAARQKCGDKVCVSADGSALASNGNNKPTEKMLRKMREHMLYLEDLPAGTTVKTLHSQFPTIKSIHLPLTSIIHQTCSNGPEVASFDLDWLQLLAFHPQTASPDSPVWSIKLPGFVFVSFDEYYDMRIWLNWVWERGSKELEYIESHSFETSSKTVADFEWEYVRILPMETWHTRTQEYQSLMHKRRSLLDVTMSSRAGSHASGAEYEPGVVITYTGVHKSTSRKVLKQLFELIAPVSYIDHTIHQTNGFVRFKTAQGASRAFHYFSRQCIVQCSPKDIGTLITSSTQLRKIQEKLSNGSKKGSTEVDEEGWGEYGMEFDDDGEEDDNQELVGIKVRILEGREEREYWDSIHQVRLKHRTHNKHGAFQILQELEMRPCIEQRPLLQIQSR